MCLKTLCVCCARARARARVWTAGTHFTKLVRDVCLWAERLFAPWARNVVTSIFLKELCVSSVINLPSPTTLEISVDETAYMDETDAQKPGTIPTLIKSMKHAWCLLNKSLMFIKAAIIWSKIQ